jgi:hypothetical protein
VSTAHAREDVKILFFSRHPNHPSVNTGETNSLYSDRLSLRLRLPLLIYPYLQSHKESPFTFLPIHKQNQECIFDNCLRRLLARDRHLQDETVFRGDLFGWQKLAFFSLELSMRHPHRNGAHRFFSLIAHPPCKEPLARIRTPASLDLLNTNARLLTQHRLTIKTS